MKKNYILSITFLAFKMMMNAQIISDDFEAYTPGAIGAQSVDWSTFDPASSPQEDLQIVGDFFNSGSQAGFIGNGQVQDAILLLGDLTSGVYTLTFQMRVASGSSAYFNIQGVTSGGFATGAKNSGDIFFNDNSNTNAGNGNDTADASTFSYPEDAFFPVNIVFDLDASTPNYTLYVDGVQVNASPVDFQTDSTLGAIDFYSVFANTSYWIDDVVFEAGNILGVNNKSIDGFAVYPNPVKNVLHIKTNDAVNSVTVYDILGKVALNAQPNAISPDINTSNLASGMYLVKIKVGNNTKTVKIIK